MHTGTGRVDDDYVGSSVTGHKFVGQYIFHVAGKELGVANAVVGTVYTRIFNGFGNPTSGITQELVALVILVVFMLVYFILLRQKDNQAPIWAAIVAIVIAVIVDIVCAHSYMVVARPAWDNILQVIAIIGGSCAVGPAIVAIVCHCKKEDTNYLGVMVIVGTIIGLATTLIYLISMIGISGSFATINATYLDPVNPTAPMFDASTVGPFLGDALPWSIVAIAGGVVSVVVAFIGKIKNIWLACGITASIAAFAEIVCLRAVFFLLGVTVYNFYGITG